MKREIFEVTAKVVDANGSYNTVSGYPKTFDSHNYGDDVGKARQRAYGEYHEALGAMCKRDDRQLQLALILRVSDGVVLEATHIGAIADVGDQ